MVAMTSNLFWSRHILPNGLRVLLYPRQSANTAQLSLAVEFGSNHETEQQAGIAHFIEHMIAGGSKERIERSRKVEDYGGVLDFYTDHEYVMSTMDILPHKLVEASNILSELFFSDKFSEDKFSIEKKIILNELAEVADDPTEKVQETLLDNLFKHHPIKRPIGGFPKTVKKLTLDQLKAAHNTNYVPKNMVLVLSGNYSERDAQIVLGHFKSKAHQRLQPKKPLEVEEQKIKPLIMRKKIGLTQSYLSMGARTVPSSHKDSPALTLISILLGGGTSSRLFAELREKHAVTYDVSATHSKGRDYGFFNVYCAVNSKNVEKAKHLILKELQRLRTEKVLANELERSKNMILGAALRGIDSLEEAPDILTYMEIQFQHEQALVDYIADIKAVTSDDLLVVANRYLCQDCFSTVILNPT
jgi:predicted Zn-dependent peptidase